MSKHTPGSCPRCEGKKMVSSFMGAVACPECAAKDGKGRTKKERDAIAKAKGEK